MPNYLGCDCWALNTTISGFQFATAGAFLVLARSLRRLLVRFEHACKELAPELVESNARSVRSACHDYGSQVAEDKARESDEEWADRRRAAMATVQRVLRRGELGVSRAVLASLQAIDDRHSDIASRYNREELDYVAALEEDAASSRRALDEVREAIKHEV